ncbi:hypothetical protein TorRG33x02_351060 [Trema orientale]|uniref:Uncharacterized protein n=1 Tax=Trema orientale TaxID=63057 RepID=A0A2P5AGF4_TREOI|nr:hypothetical protein TorRG33x02_351060 [Trema orientale]
MLPVKGRPTALRRPEEKATKTMPLYRVFGDFGSLRPPSTPLSMSATPTHLSHQPQTIFQRRIALIRVLPFLDIF